MTERVDVVVVGLGPAGASAAAAAARRGAKVLGIERRRTVGRPVQCAEFVPAMIGTEVAALAPCVRQAIESMRTFVEHEAPDVELHFPGYMLDRAAFDAARLADAVEAGARCLLGVGAQSIDAVAGSIALADGRVVQAGIIVGADGPHSRVGRALGAVNTCCLETRQITVPLLGSRRSTDIYLSGTIPGGYGWLFPKAGVANLGAGVLPRERARLRTVVGELHRTLAAQRAVGARILALTGGAIPVGGPLAPAHRAGKTLVLLAGDAAGLTNPITGAGIVSAVVSGRLAGEAAAAYLGGDPAAARDFEDELDLLFGASHARALRHRHALEAAWAGGRHPGPAALRQGWIAYPEYWSQASACPLEALS